MFLPDRLWGALRRSLFPQLATTALVLLAGAAMALPAWAEEPSGEASGTQILQSFERANAPPAPTEATDKTRRWVMFALGAPLLLLLLVTGSLGIAMGVYGKPVYLAHMVCAGLSVTLAVVHAIVGLVWFRPF